MLFISNELVSPTVARDLRLPLEFVTFAHIEGKMYRHFMNQGTFVARETRQHGNDVVYGALFHVRDFFFYATLLDAYHVCSLASIGRNHHRDLHHRIETDATPIHFQSVEQLERLLYLERDPVRVMAYVGNPTHPKIRQRLAKKTVSFRLVDGIDPHYKDLIREVLPQ